MRLLFLRYIYKVRLEYFLYSLVAKLFNKLHDTRNVTSCMLHKEFCVPVMKFCLPVWANIGTDHAL
jgi:hypothetical protein